jgi:hypothetical protein
MWDDVDRAAAWRLLERPGFGVGLDIGKGLLVERSVGEPLHWANLKGVTSPDWVVAQLQALLQSAGMGSAEMTTIGQAGVGVLTT